MARPASPAPASGRGVPPSLALLAGVVVALMLTFAAMTQRRDAGHHHAGGPDCAAAAARSAAAAPPALVQRRVGVELAEDLLEQLRGHDARRLVVVLGPAEANASMPLDLDALGRALEDVRVVRRTADVHALPGAASTGCQPSALLVAAHNARLAAGTAAIAAAAAQRVRPVVTFSYSSHDAKGDSLVSFAPSGVPLSAAFQSTNVFRDAFTKIYDAKSWGAAGGGSGSGSGLEWTKRIRATLPRIIQRYNITSMLDSSCGSMFWMPSVLADVERANPSFRFMGADVACSLIARHKQDLAAAHKNWRFECLDYANMALPRGYDLVFSRDSLQHVPLHATYNFLHNVRASGAKFLLVGSYINNTEPNVDITGGDYFPLDLLKPPFNVTPVLEVVDEESRDNKHMLLLDVKKMRFDDQLPGLV